MRIAPLTSDGAENNLTCRVIFVPIDSWDDGFLEPLELLGPSSELASGVDDTLIHRS
jgi:hypothetical protein